MIEFMIPLQRLSDRVANAVTLERLILSFPVYSSGPGPLLFPLFLFPHTVLYLASIEVAFFVDGRHHFEVMFPKLLFFLDSDFPM